MSARLITMAGPKDIPLQDLSNFEAGLAFLGVVGQVYPGIKFGQLYDLAYRPETMAGWLTNLGRNLNPVRAFNTVADAVGDIKDGIGDVLKDTFTTVGSATGSAVRLLTDEGVVTGATKIYNASQDPQQAQSMNDQLQAMMAWISNLGANAKAQAATASLPGGPLPWLAGGGILLALVLRRR